MFWSLLKRCLLYVYLNIIGFFKLLQEQIWDRHRKIPRVDLPSEDEEWTIVLTGGNRGIGLEAAKTMLQLGPKIHVIIGCRSPSKCRDTLGSFDKAKGTFEVLQLDLTCMDSVRRFAKEVIDRKRPVHSLVNNAGIMFGKRSETRDGFESQLCTNHLGHFLLTHLLMPVLGDSGREDRKARIVNVSSVAHYGGSWMDFEDLNCRKFYSPIGGYGNSKAAQIMFTLYLDANLRSSGSNVVVNCLHPGVIWTGLYANASYVVYLVCCLMKSAKQGSDSIVHAALSKSIEGKGGLYFDNSRTKEPSGFVRSLENQAKMWRASMEMLEISGDFGR